MRLIAIIALVSAQTVAGAPALAGNVVDQSGEGSPRHGAFAGARLRIPFGGADAGNPRAGLAVAPISYRASLGGNQRMRFGEGFEFGFAGSARPQLSIAGQPASRFARRGVPGEKKANLSTIGWVGVGVGAVVVAGALVVLHFSSCGGLFSDQICEE